MSIFNAIAEMFRNIFNEPLLVGGILGVLGYAIGFGIYYLYKTIMSGSLFS
jgi:hypothetical protein